MKDSYPSIDIAIRELETAYAAGNYLRVELGASAIVLEHPNSIEAYLLLGHSRIAQHKAAEAKSTFKQALSIAPDNSQNLIGLARAQLMLGETSSAIESCQRALKLAPGHWETEVTMADACLEFGDWNNAELHYRNALALHQNSADLWLGLGISLQRLGRLTESIAMFEKAIVLDPHHHSGYCNAANSLALAGRFDLAIQYYETALSISPEIPALYVNLANAYLASDRAENAETCSRRALELAAIRCSSPAEAALVCKEAHGFLGDALRSLGKFDDAASHFELQGSPDGIAKALECTYLSGQWSRLDNLIENVCEGDNTNIRAAAFCNFAATQRQGMRHYAFCPNPMSYIQVRNIVPEVDSFESFCAGLMTETSSLGSVWNPPNKSTHGGFQSTENVFCLKTPNITAFKKLLRKFIHEYFEQFEGSTDHFVRKRPSTFELSGWVVRLSTEGWQDAHIHPSGWLSGVLYLRVPKFHSVTEGAINFVMAGYDLPVANAKLEQKLYQPATGDLVLFPSCLFHKTLPFSADEERISLAFDLLPGS